MYKSVYCKSYLAYKSAVGVNAQKYLISVEIVAHYRKLELHFFSTDDFRTSLCVLFGETLETYVPYIVLC